MLRPRACMRPATRPYVGVVDGHDLLVTEMQPGRASVIGNDDDDEAAIQAYVRNHWFGHHAPCSTAPFGGAAARGGLPGQGRRRTARRGCERVFPHLWGVFFSPSFFFLLPIYLLSEKASEAIHPFRGVEPWAVGSVGRGARQVYNFIIPLDFDAAIILVSIIYVNRVIFVGNIGKKNE